MSPFDGKFYGNINSISTKYDKWESELNDDYDREYLLEGIKNGFRISTIESEQEVKVVDCTNHTSAMKHKRLVENDLKEQLELGNYVKSAVPPTIVSPIGAIPKSEDEVRMIHDGSRPTSEAMNDYSVLHSVHYQTLEEAYSQAKPNYFLSKIDLKAAYRSVPINRLDYCLTGLKWQFEDEESPSYLFDTRLPFGASMAPSVFHRLTQSVRRMMKRKGFHNLIVYLDDFLIIEKTYEDCLKAQHTLISLLIDLGFYISWKKVVGPSQSLTFLGIVIDTATCSLSLESKRLEKIHDKLMFFNDKKHVSKRQLQQLAGLLN